MTISMHFARSFFKDKIADKNKAAYDYFLQQEKNYWLGSKFVCKRYACFNTST